MKFKTKAMGLILFPKTVYQNDVCVHVCHVFVGVEREWGTENEVVSQKVIYINESNNYCWEGLGSFVVINFRNVLVWMWLLKRYVQILILETCWCDLILKRGVCRCNKLGTWDPMVDITIRKGKEKLETQRHRNKVLCILRQRLELCCRKRRILKPPPEAERGKDSSF